MDQAQIDGLAKILSERLEAQFKSHYDEVCRRLESIQKTLDLQLANTDNDRRDFAQMKINQATIAQGIKEIVDMIQNMSKRTAEKVVDQTNAAMETAADRVVEGVEPVLRRMVAGIKNGLPPKNKKWYQFWR